VITFDLDPATLAPGPVSTWDGAGVTLTRYQSSWPDPTRTLRSDLPVVRFPGPAGTQPQWMVGNTADDPAPEASFHLVLILEGSPEWGSDLCFLWGRSQLGVAIWPENQVGSVWSHGPFIPGTPTVVSVLHDGTSTSTYIDGRLVGTEASGSGTGAQVSLRNTTRASLDVLRSMGTSGSTVESLEVMRSLVDQYLPSRLSASGSWSMTGAVALSESDPWDPPTPPVFTPGGALVPPPPPPPQAPPVGVAVDPIRRVSEVMPTPTFDQRGNPVDWEPTDVRQGLVGHLQIVVEGVDITYLGDAEMPFPSFSRVEPFGSDQADIQLPVVTAFHQPGEGWLWWCREGANVDIRLARPDGSTQSMFAGVVASLGHHEESGAFTLGCLGVMFAADLQLRPPAFITTPRDAGSVIPEVINQAIGRRFNPIAEVVTGIPVSVLGGWESRVSGWSQRALATLVTGGSQWTVTCDERSPAMVLKDVDNIAWTVHNGQRGIDVDLIRDATQAPNVIYAEGIGPDGGRWRNAKYPNWRPDDTPDFPNTPIRSITVGWTDARTTTKSGVSTWQAKAGQPVTGRFSQSDRAALRRMQQAAGVQRDGVLGPQSWAMTFGTGSNTGTLDGAFIMPAAFSPSVEPRLFGPDGDDLGDNPAYSPGVLRVERYINYGPGATKADGVRASEEILARDSQPGWVGTVTMELDPEEGSRLEVVREGTNGLVRGFRGNDLKVHVAQVQYSATSVTATVDTNARDFPTLDAILDRDREATDPARSYRKSTNSGELSSDRATWDAESPGGHIPRLALFSNLWTVVRIPVAQYGSIVRTEFTSTGPKRAFSIAVFDRPITAAALLGLVGNPLWIPDADDLPEEGVTNPWQTKSDALDDAGLLMSWGWAKQPAGYYPGQYSDPDGEDATPVTGRMVDDASWDYASTQPPWLWVAMIAEGSTFIEGRFWHGVS